MEQGFLSKKQNKCIIEVNLGKKSVDKPLLRIIVMVAWNRRCFTSFYHHCGGSRRSLAMK